MSAFIVLGTILSDWLERAYLKLTYFSVELDVEPELSISRSSHVVMH